MIEFTRRLWKCIYIFDKIEMNRHTKSLNKMISLSDEKLLLNFSLLEEPRIFWLVKEHILESIIWYSFV